MFYLAISADFSAEPLLTPDLRKRDTLLATSRLSVEVRRCLLLSVATRYAVAKLTREEHGLTRTRNNRLAWCAQRKCAQ